MPITQYDQHRRRTTARSLKEARNSLNRGQKAFRDAISEFVNNDIITGLLLEVGELEAACLAGSVGRTYVSDAWDRTDLTAPKRVFTYDTPQQATDENGDLMYTDGDEVADENGVEPGGAGYIPTYEQVPVWVQETRTLTYCPAERYIYGDTDAVAEGGLLRFHPSADAPSVKEFVEILYGGFSFGAITGDVVDAEIQQVFGRSAATPSEVSALFDYWP
jgi:hypothetical protein